MEEQIRANAEMVVEKMRKVSGIDFGYTQESVNWLEGFIERQRTSGGFDNQDEKKTLISVFGSYLGECIVRCYGGTWRLHDGVWCVGFDEKNVAFPFAKVEKQIDNGLEDGIASFFEIIPYVFKTDVGAAPSVADKPWWKVW